MLLLYVADQIPLLLGLVLAVVARIGNRPRTLPHTLLQHVLHALCYVAGPPGFSSDRNMISEWEARV